MAKTTVKKKATDDLIVNVSVEVENYTKEEAYKAASTLEDDVEFSYFRLGGILNRINSEGWYADEEFAKFSDFVEATFGIKRAKAMYLIKIYNDLVASEIPWTAVKSLGWSKLKEISSVITKKNVKGWVKKAEGISVIALIALVRASKADSTGSGDSTDPGATPDISSMAFKVHKDQKEVITEAVDKAKEEIGTDHANAALESICLGYLAGPSKPKLDKGGKEEAAAKPTLAGLKAMMKTFEYMEVLETFDKIWPEVDLTVHDKG